MATERLAILLETIGTSSTVRELEKLSGATKGLGDKATAASGMLKGLGGSSQQLLGAMGGMAGVLTASAAGWSAIIGFGVHAVGTFSDLAQEVLKFQRASGASAEQSSALIAAFDDMGIAAETGSKAVFQLGKRLDSQGAALAEFGVHAAIGADGNTDLAETLLNVADAYTQTADPAKRAQLVAAAFGKTGQELIPILEQGRVGIERLFENAAATGQILSREDIAKAENYRLAMDELGDSLREISLNAGQALIPAITKVADAFSGLVQKATDLGDNRFVKFLMGPITVPFQALTAGADTTAGALRGVKERAQEVAADLDKAEKEGAKFRDTAFGLADAQRDVDTATRGLSAAQRDLSDKQSALTKLLAKGAVDEKKVAEARRDVADATRGLDDATKDLGDAQRTLSRVLQPATVEQLASAYARLHGAELDLTDAQDGLSEATATYNRMLAASQGGFSLDPASADELAIAQDDVNDSFSDWQDVLKDGVSSVGDIARAHKRYTDALADQLALQKRGIVTEGELADQHDAVERATIAVDTATGNVTGVTQDYYDVLHTGAENDPKVISAREGVATATQHVADATQNVTDKQTVLGTALSGDPNYKDNVRDARQGVADATQHVADASFNVSQKVYDATQKQNDFNAALEDGAGYAKDLRTELDELAKKHPELAPLFAPVLGALATAITQGVAGTPGGVTRGIVPGHANVPHAAAGGIVTRPTLAMIGEAGPEAIIPLSRGGGVGGTIYVTVNAGIAGDADRVGNEIYAVLKRLAARNGGLGLN